MRPATVERNGFGVFCGRWSGEQPAHALDGAGTVAIGNQTIVPDAMDALGQHVHQEAPDELRRGQRYRL